MRKVRAYHGKNTGKGHSQTGIDFSISELFKLTTVRKASMLTAVFAVRRKISPKTGSVSSLEVTPLPSGFCRIKKTKHRVLGLWERTINSRKCLEARSEGASGKWPTPFSSTKVTHFTSIQAFSPVLVLRA